jgi:hypothetical protein
MEYEQLITAVRHRRDIPNLCNALGFTGHGAEIGVQYGEFSVWMLAKSNLSVFYSVDYWDHPKRDSLANMADYMTAVARIGQYCGRSVIMRMEHTKAANIIPDKSLDFVYFDIGFDKASVTEGIETWWPKVRNGGLFCGHIFHKVVLEDHTVEDTIAPREALADFLNEVNLTAHYTTEVPGRGTNSWIVRKPIDF